MPPTHPPNPWDHKDEWRRRSENFTVVVSRHFASGQNSESEDGVGPHRWAVYAYIYPSHPLFAGFDRTGTMSQPAALSLPLHGGPSLLR
jgi:hypothetical protein